MSGRRLDVTATQTIASMLAALTGAVAASGLGVGGTVVGAAVMSLASTVVASVYKHYLARSHQRIVAAASTLTPQRSRHARRPRGTPGAPAGAGAQPGAGAPTAAGAPAAAPALAARDQSAAARTRLTANGQYSPATAVAADVALAILRDQAAFGRNAGLGDPSALPEETEPELPPRRRRRWLMLAAAMAGVFIATMGLVTVVEAAAGKPLETLIWHKHASGTTIGRLVGGTSAGHARPPARSPSPATTPSAPPTTTPAQQAPTPGPTPVPSGSAGSGSGGSGSGSGGAGAGTTGSGGTGAAGTGAGTG